MRILILSTLNGIINLEHRRNIEYMIGSLALDLSRHDEVDKVTLICCKGSKLLKLDKLEIRYSVDPQVVDPIKDIVVEHKLLSKIKDMIPNYDIVCDFMNHGCIGEYEDELKNTVVCHVFYKKPSEYIVGSEYTHLLALSEHLSKYVSRLYNKPCTTLTGTGLSLLSSSLLDYFKREVVAKGKAGKGGYPMDPILHKDQGDYFPKKAKDVNKFGKEAYK